MTEQEVRVFAKRLRRIWGRAVHRPPIHPAEEWVFDAVLRPDVRLQVCGKEPGRQEFFLRFFSAGVRWVNQVAEFRVSSDGTVTWNPGEEDDKELATQFEQQWREVFRRNCWLSGCDVEASAHEKAEWIQGFTKEETETWNLKV